MPTSSRSAARRVGQVGTGLGALIVLIGLLAGAPVALAALAGNPLPDHVPGLGEITAALTSRDDGQLFVRALAVVGWAGWATFALSVLVELPARALRRPAPRLPGMGRQQRAAAALLGSVALILAASPAASAATSLAAPVVATAPQTLPAGAAPVYAAGPAPAWLAGPPTRPVVPEPVYRVERDDYLGHIADRYLGDFDRYPELARLNKIRDADRIRPGQLLHLPDEATDHGVREHATGLVATPPPPGGWPEGGSPESAAPPAVTEFPAEEFPSGELPDGEVPAADVPAGEVPAGEHNQTTTFTYGASRAGELNGLNRPLAVSAVIATAGIVGAQVGAVLGLRRRPATSRSGSTGKSGSGRSSGSGPAAESGRAGDSGRHRLRDDQDG